MAQTQRETQTQRTPPTTRQRDDSYELYIPPRFHWERTHGEEEGEEEASKENGKRTPRGWCAPVKVVAVYDNGECEHFPSVQDAARQRKEKGEKGICAAGVLKCCRSNKRRQSLRNGTRTPSTEHRYCGVRYYFGTDNIWMVKIGESVEEKENKQKTQIWRQWL